MCDSAPGVRDAIATIVRALEATILEAPEALTLLGEFAEIERLAAAGRILAIKSLADTNAHHDLGYRTPAELVASRTRGSLSEAIGAVAAAGALDTLPALRRQLVSGKVSSLQAGLIAQAASADPSAEPSLLAAAGREPLARLRERCQMVRAAAAGDESATERIRAERYLRYWIDRRDGACRIEARVAPDDAAPLISTVEARADRLQLEAHRAGRFEPLEAFRADALCALAEPNTGPRAIAHIRVDATALERGRLEPGETCEVDGLGPISVTAAKQSIKNSFVAVIEREGVDVRRVVRLGRSIPAAVRTALWERDGGRCVICGSRRGLEIDHIYGYAITRRTTLDELVLLCRYHHRKKTHRGWRLSGGHGNWRLEPPQAGPHAARAPPRS